MITRTLIAMLLTSLTVANTTAEEITPPEACEFLISLDLAAGQTHSIDDIAPFRDDDATVRAFQLFKDRSQTAVEIAEEMRLHLHEVISGTANQETHRKLERLAVRYIDLSSAAYRAGVFYDHIGGGGNVCTPKDARAKITELKGLRAHAERVTQAYQGDQNETGDMATNRFIEPPAKIVDQMIADSHKNVIEVIDKLIPPLEAVADCDGSSVDIDSQVAIICYETSYCVHASLAGEPYETYSGYRDYSAPSDATVEEKTHPVHALIEVGEFSVATAPPSGHLTQRLDFHLQVVVDREHKNEVMALVEANRRRLHDRIISSMTGLDIVDLTRERLGALHERLFAETNEIVRDPLLQSVVVADYAVENDMAERANLEHRLRVIREQIKRYRERSGGYPSLANLASELGFGTMPDNPVNGSCVVMAVTTPGVEPTAVGPSGAGWLYDESTGGFFPNNPEAYPADDHYGGPSEIAPMAANDDDRTSEIEHADEPQADLEAASKIPEYLVVALNISLEFRPALLTPGDRVDVLAIIKNDAAPGKPRERLILTDITVFGVNDSGISLIVSQDQADILNAANALVEFRVVAARDRDASSHTTQSTVGDLLE